MQNNFTNEIQFDIRKILPNLGVSLQQEELIDKIPINQFIEKADEINQLHLGNAGEINNDISHIIKVDDYNVKAVGLGCLTGIHTFNGNYKKAIASINQALSLKTNEEVYAYILTEYANLLRQLMRVDEAIAILNQASRITTNEKLEWRIKAYQGYCYKYKNKEKSLKILMNAVRYYMDKNELGRYGTILRHIGAIHLQYNEIDLAENYLEQAKTLAEKFNQTSLLWGIKNDIGWLLVMKKEYDNAIDIYSDLNKIDKGPYYNSLVIQNIAYIEFERVNFQNAIELHKKSLKITTKYEIYEMMFEDYYKLGLSYEKIGDYRNAEKYYSEGFKKLQMEQNVFGSMISTGYRGLLLNQYFKFLSYKPTIEHARSYAKTFEFFKGKKYNKIIGIFQKHLLSMHRQRTETIKDLCNKLKISMRLYFVYQKRLGGIDNILKSNKIQNQHFINYLHSMETLDWRSAIKQFDTDLYTFLLQYYKYNKTKIAEALDVSILTVINKTADIE